MIRIKKDDTVVITAGKDKGKEGKVLQTFPALSRVVVDGMNIATKNLKAKSEHDKGQKVTYPAPFDMSNVMLKCGKCSRAVRVGSKTLEDGTKVRVCKKCAEQL